MLGRVSESTKADIIAEFGEENVIEATVSKFRDNEAYAALYRDPDTDGKLKDLDDEKVRELIDIELLKRELSSRKIAGADVTIINSASGDNISARALSLLFTVPMLKEQYGARSVHVLEPYTPFMRNDRDFSKKIVRNGETLAEYPQANAVSCSYYARMLKMMGADTHTGFAEHSQDAASHFMNAFGARWLSPVRRIFDLIPFKWNKLRQTFNVAAEALHFKPNSHFVSTAPLFAELLQNEETVRGDIENGNIIIGAPDGGNKMDDEAIRRAVDLRNALPFKSTPENISQDPNMFFITKRRIDEKHTEITDFRIGGNGSVQGKTAILVDDIISSGSTLFDAAKKLKENGAKRVIATVSHGVLVNGALENILNNNDLDEVWITDSIPSTVEKHSALFHAIRTAEINGEITKEEAEAKLQALSKIKIKSMASLVIDSVYKISAGNNLAFANENPHNHMPSAEAA